MIISESEINHIRELSGLRSYMIEKVIQLLNLLNKLNSHPYLKNKLILKGGSALNLFIFKIPRLSVDIDLNYVGFLNRDQMVKDRPKIMKAIEAVLSREEFSIRRVPDEHAGGKFRTCYQSYTGQTNNLEMDLNFMLRLPLWDVKKANSYGLGRYNAVGIPILDLHELVAAKLVALFARKQMRDLFDTSQILKLQSLKPEKLKLGFIVYGAMNRIDWRTISLDELTFDIKDLHRNLLPLLTTNAIPDEEEQFGFLEKLQSECRENLKDYIRFTDREMKFLDEILDRGRIEVSLLTDDPRLQDRILNQPMLKWKALNVRRHYSLE